QLQVLVAADPAVGAVRVADLRLAPDVRRLRSRGVRDLLAMLHDAAVRGADGARHAAYFGWLAGACLHAGSAAAHLQAAARRLRPVAVVRAVADDGAAGVHRHRPDAVPQPAA